VDTAFLEARKAALESMITAYEAAITAISTNNKKMYMLDTGQTVVRVTQENIGDIQSSYEKMLVLYDTICGRLNGTGGIMRPAW
jgi:phage-related tail protein